MTDFLDLQAFAQLGELEETIYKAITGYYADQGGHLREYKIKQLKTEEDINGILKDIDQKEYLAAQICQSALKMSERIQKLKQLPTVGDLKESLTTKTVIAGIKKEARAIYKDIQDAAQDTDRLVRSLQDLENKIDMQTRTIFGEKTMLLAMLKDFPSGVYLFKSGHHLQLMPVTNPAIAQSKDGRDVNFGRFGIVFGLNEDCTRATFSQLCPIEPLIPPGRDRRYGSCHPHVNGIHLCLGHGDNPVHHALAKNDIQMAAHIIYAVLSDGKNEGHYHLDHWIHPACDNCGVVIVTATDPHQKCVHCASILCQRCAVNRQCDHCGSYVCTHHKQGKRLSLMNVVDNKTQQRSKAKLCGGCVEQFLQTKDMSKVS